jgi:hypothetical protein
VKRKIGNILLDAVYSKMSKEDIYYNLEAFMRHSEIKFPSTWFELDWVDNWDFEEEIFFGETHFMNTYRRYFLSQAVRIADQRIADGVNVEIGSYLGFGSRIMLRNSTKDLVVVDSFEGLSTPNEYDGNYWKPGDLSVSDLQFRKNISEFSSRVKIHKGWIPKVFESIAIDKISFIYIDVDLYEPTKSALNWAVRYLDQKAFILCDDYGFKTCPGVKRACDEFVSENPEFVVLPLPVGSALIFRV